jgi:membrane fusion protein (multidrug efflux system)
MKIIKRIILTVIILALAGAIVYKAVWAKAEQNLGNRLTRTAIPVNLLVAKPENLTETLPVIGSIEANEEVILKSEVSGKITGIFFEEGQYVRKDTLLIKVYDDDLRAQLVKAQSALKLARDVEDRQRQLLDREAISQQEYDVAFANLQAAQADVALLESQISKTEIKAPFDGRIGFRKVSPGEYITPGVDIASLVSDNPAKIQFTVPERYSQLLGVNTVIRFRLQGQAVERSAKVYAVAPAIDEVTRSLELKALAPNPAGALIPGAYARIDVLMQTQKNVVMIPVEAILSESDGEKVYLYRGGKAEKVKVESGSRNNSRAHIIRGITPGDTVITTGIMQITPRSEVNPTQIN